MGNFLWGKRKMWHLVCTQHGKCNSRHHTKRTFLFLFRSMVSSGFVPNPELAALPSCSCFCVPERHAAAAGGKRSSCCCVSVTGYYWVSVPLCAFVRDSEQWQGRAEAWQFLVRASGKLLSSSWFAGNIVSAHQDWSEKRKKKPRKKGRWESSVSVSIPTSKPPQRENKEVKTWLVWNELSHRFTL